MLNELTKKKVSDFLLFKTNNRYHVSHRVTLAIYDAIDIEKDFLTGLSGFKMYTYYRVGSGRSAKNRCVENSLLECAGYHKRLNDAPRGGVLGNYLLLTPIDRILLRKKYEDYLNNNNLIKKEYKNYLNNLKK
jgi:hypothetical protein